MRKGGEENGECGKKGTCSGNGDIGVSYCFLFFSHMYITLDVLLPSSF